jgi:hypothetical protein
MLVPPFWTWGAGAFCDFQNWTAASLQAAVSLGGGVGGGRDSVAFLRLPWIYPADGPIPSERSARIWKFFPHRFCELAVTS